MYCKVYNIQCLTWALFVGRLSRKDEYSMNTHGLGYLYYNITGWPFRLLSHNFNCLLMEKFSEFFGIKTNIKTV